MRLVDTTIEPHLQKANELRSLNKRVYLFELRGRTFVAEDGTPLDLLMYQCALSESLRQRTVVFLPEYDLRLTGERLLTGYTIFHRPVAGRTPIGFPELEIIESLIYKTSWERTEVGELARSINLAPGERREVTVTRTSEFETTETSATTSVFDLTSQEDTDLATELERRTRNESNVVDKVSASASYSANSSANQSWGTGSGSASASASASAAASRDKSVTDIGEDMAKSAQRAARSISESRREEVSTTRSSRSLLATSDVSVSTIENINQGRTLNLMFYRLYNRYLGMLLLEDLHLTVKSGYEVIAGSGIRTQTVYPIHSIDAVVEELSNTPLPLNLTDDLRWQFKLEILRAIAVLVFDEYKPYDDSALRRGQNNPANLNLRGATKTATVADSDTDQESANQLINTVTALKELQLPSTEGYVGPVLKSASSPQENDGDATQEVTLSSKSATNFEEAYKDLSQNLENALEPMSFGGISVHHSQILVAAKGLYLDSQVGMTPSTEPYSEDMRRAEVKMRLAEVARVRSETARNLAMARRLLRSGDILQNGGNRIVAVTAIDNELHISLSAPLGAGTWQLQRGGLDAAELHAANEGDTELVHVWGKTPDWHVNQDFSLISVVNRETGERIDVDSLSTDAVQIANRS